MVETRKITDWRLSTTHGGVYERLLGALGTEEFGSTVRDSVIDVAGAARRIYLFEATGRAENTLQYYSGEPGLAELFPAYLKMYLRQDPVVEGFRIAPRAGDVVVQRVRPTDIASPEFRRRIFEDAGIVERISIIQRGPSSWRVINVARHASDGCLAEKSLTALIGLSCLLLPMLPLNRHRRREPIHLTVDQLEDRFAARFVKLTQRERQVVARAAIGMSVEATALDLRIAKTSVLTYRRRAYQRLNVTSPFELSALVAH
ncbi:MAG: LuxR C-terminal-related transcriptional regulator [Steroidobacteraceae bacterium]